MHCWHQGNFLVSVPLIKHPHASFGQLSTFLPQAATYPSCSPSLALPLVRLPLSELWTVSKTWPILLACHQSCETGCAQSSTPARRTALLWRCSLSFQCHAVLHLSPSPTTLGTTLCACLLPVLSADYNTVELFLIYIFIQFFEISDDTGYFVIHFLNRRDTVLTWDRRLQQITIYFRYFGTSRGDW